MGLSFNIGLNSLLTAQSQLETIGHNLANANTPGYSRQETLVSTRLTINTRGLLQGTGVQADVVKRTVDTLLQGRILRQSSAVGRMESRFGVLSEAESYLGTSDGNGLNVYLQNFFGGLSTAATSPGDKVLRTSAVQESLQLSGRFNELNSDTQRLREDTVRSLEKEVEEVNGLLRQIGDLNRQIADLEVGSTIANDARDRRDQLLKDLSEQLDVRAVDDGRGSVRVLLGGEPLVSSAQTHQIGVVLNQDTGGVSLQIAGGKPSADVGGGKIGGLLEVLNEELPDMLAELDSLANNLILEINRVHSTGVPSDGPYDRIVASNSFVDQNGDGQWSDELLKAAGLPFPVAAGSFFVNVTDLSSGALRKTEVTIDPSRTTVGDLVASLNAIPNLTATIDGLGHLQVQAGAGHGFDFSAQLDPNPDDLGTFGGGAASLVAGPGPFSVASGDSLDLVGPSGSFTVSFPPGSFLQSGAATADEIAAVLNANPNVQGAGLVASTVGDRLVLQTSGTGAGETFTVSGGTAASGLGWPPGTVVAGQDTPVDVVVSGSYAGADNQKWTFVPSADGTVGTTPGLTVGVFSGGVKIADLDVGAGYTPGDELEILDGVAVSFGFGDLSATHGDFVELDVVADSDTSDVLPALGLGALFTGSDAATISVRSDLEMDPGLLATSLAGASGDGTILLDLVELEQKGLGGLNGLAIGEAYSDFVGEIGIATSSARTGGEAEQFLLRTLEGRRDSVSAVNTDEELVNMIEAEQAYSAAAEFIRVVNDLTAELMNLV